MADRKLYPAGELDVAIPPGQTLAELMEERGLTGDAVCDTCCLSPATLDGVLDGTLPVDPDIARQLECRFGVSAKLWLNLQRDYDRARNQALIGSFGGLSDERAHEYLVRLAAVMSDRGGSPDLKAKQELDDILAEAQKEAARLCAEGGDGP